MKYGLIAIGASLGGLQAVRQVLGLLPATFRLPLAIVQHRDRDAGETLRFVLQEGCALAVVEAQDKQVIEAGTVYLAPSGYHLLVEEDHFALATEDPLAFVQPSIDVLFETVAESLGPRAIGLVLTGSGADGAAGLAAIRRCGGVALVQSPATAYAPDMPLAAKRAAPEAREIGLEGIAPYLVTLSEA